MGSMPHAIPEGYQSVPQSRAIYLPRSRVARWDDGSRFAIALVRGLISMGTQCEVVESTSLQPQAAAGVSVIHA